MKKALNGFRAWLIQRLSAVYLLAFLVFILGHFAFDPPASYSAWQAWVARPANMLAIWLFFVSLGMHAWIGLRDAALDYVGPLPARVLVLALLALALLAIVAWASRTVLLAHP